jgi:hypothetical protein
MSSTLSNSAFRKSLKWLLRIWTEWGLTSSTFGTSWVSISSV